MFESLDTDQVSEIVRVQKLEDAARKRREPAAPPRPTKPGDIGFVGSPEVLAKVQAIKEASQRRFRERKRLTEVPETG